MRKYALALIPLIAILAFWQIYKLYLGYEDLALFYMLQHRAEALAELARQPNFNIYRHHFWLIPWQFKLFGYNPLPYYVISVLTYIASGFTLYWFVRKLASSKSALVAAAVFMSGYFGLETIWWSASNGHQTYLVVILLLASTGFLIEYAQKGKLPNYLVSLVLFALTIFLFQFRAFLLFFPPLITLGLFRRPVKKAIYEVLPFIAIFALVIAKAAGSGVSNISHSSTLPILDGIKAVVGNIGASAMPLSLFTKEELVIPIYIVVGLVVVGLLAKRAKQSQAWAWVLGYLVFTSAATAGSVFLGGSPILVYENSVRFITPIFLGIAITIGLSYEHFSEQKYTSIVICGFVALNIVLANFYIATRSSRHSELKTFYTSLKREMAQLPEKAVIQIGFLRNSIGSFTPGYVVPPDAYLAGLYGKQLGDVKLSKSFDESIDYLRTNNLNETNWFFFNYDQGNIENMSGQLREVLRKGENTVQPKYAFAPALIEFEVTAASKLIDPACSVNDRFLDQIILQKTALTDAVVSSTPQLSPHNGADLVDSSYDKSWTALDWKSTPGFELSLTQSVTISQIRWPELPGRRTGRMPAQYQLEISSDGKRWQEVVAHKTFSPTPVHFIKLAISKTIDGRPPQIDELDIFGEPLSDEEYKEFISLKNSPIACVRTEEVKERLLRSFNNTVTFPIKWKIDGNPSRSETEITGSVPLGRTSGIIINHLNYGQNAAFGNKISDVQFGEPSLPAEVTVTLTKFRYPTIAELLK